MRLWQPAQCERERARGRRVEPLDVVDREDDELVSGEQLQRAANRNAESSRIYRTCRWLVDEERNLERASLWRRQCWRNVSENVVEQISQRSVREPALRLGRTRREDAQAPFTGRFDGCEPERRLPDPRFAIQHKRGRAFGRRPSVEERTQRVELLAPTNDFDSHLAEHRDRPAAEVSCGEPTIRARHAYNRKPRFRGFLSSGGEN
ncbi:MAG TPA: hypothetical protein VGJ25_08530 [Gaiellaceae bacterium]